MLKQETQAEIDRKAAKEEARKERVAFMAKFARLRRFLGKGGELVRTEIAGISCWTTKTRNGMSFTDQELADHSTWQAEKAAKAEARTAKGRRSFENR